MDFFAGWDWRAWSLAVPLVVLVGWFGFRRVSAFVFRHFTLNSLAREHGWQVDLPTSNARAEFDEQERRRRKEARALLWKGRIAEGYRTGVFGKNQTGAWHRDVTVTGSWRGHRFTATQSKRYELTSGETTHRKVRTRASLTMAGQSVDLGPRLRRGPLLAALNRLS